MSGAGPSIIALVDENYEIFEQNVKNALANMELAANWDFMILEADNSGATVFSVQSTSLKR